MRRLRFEANGDLLRGLLRKPGEGERPLRIDGLELRRCFAAGLLELLLRGGGDLLILDGGVLGRGGDLVRTGDLIRF